MPSLPGVATDSLNLQSLRGVIDKAFNTTGVVAVVMSINCSSGSPVQCSILSKYLRMVSDISGVPLIATVEDAAVSGGYWLACAADAIFADPNSMLGSIGSVSVNCNVHGLLREYEVESRIMATHPNKIGPNPFAPMDENFEEQERIQLENMNVVHQNFIRWVKSRRGKHLKGKKSDIFDGRIFIGQEAVEHGLADFIGGKEEVENKLASVKNLSSVNWVKVSDNEENVSMLPFIFG